MYKILLSGGVLDTSTMDVIKPDKSDAQWNAYREWLHSGNVPLDPDPPVTIPLTPAEIAGRERLAAMDAAVLTMAATRATNPHIAGTPMIIERLELIELILFGPPL